MTFQRYDVFSISSGERIGDVWMTSEDQAVKVAAFWWQLPERDLRAVAQKKSEA